MKGKQQQVRKVKYPRPKWALEILNRLRQETGKRLELKYVNGSWHVHEYEEWWDPVNKRPVKRNKYIGTIKRDGFHPRRRKFKRRKKGSMEVSKEKQEKRVVPLKKEGSYEYGASRVCYEYLKEVEPVLREEFGDEEAKMLIAVALLWSVHGYVPLKRLSSLWEDTWQSREWDDISLDHRKVSSLLRQVGRRKMGRDTVSGYLLTSSQSRYVLFDLTHVFTYSEGVLDGEVGWNPERRHVPQVRVSVIHDGKQVFHMEPWQGSHREISVLRALQERLRDYISHKGELVLVADRGIASYQFATHMDKEGFRFIMPLRKNFSIIDYHQQWKEVFKYSGRVIGWSEREVDLEGHKFRLLLFWDSKLEGEEKQLWLDKYHDGEISHEELSERLVRCGKIAILTNTDMEPAEVFHYYKARAYVEESIRRFKDTLHMEGTYMHSDDALSGYLFVAMLSLLCHYKLLEQMRMAELSSNWSVEDVLLELRKVRKEPWVDGWHLRPLTRKQKNIIDKLQLNDIIWIK